MHPLPSAVLSVAISLATQEHAVAEGGEASVSACGPLCAIVLKQPSVYSLLTVNTKAKRL